MTVVTKSGYARLKEGIVSNNTISLIENHINQYFISCASKKYGKISDSKREFITKRVKDVMAKINFTILPDDVSSFNVAQYLATQQLLPEDENVSILKSSTSIATITNNSSPTKYFTRQQVQAFGYDYNEVYSKGEYLVRPGVKYQEFISLASSVVNNGIDKDKSNLPPNSQQEENIKIVSEYTSSPPETIRKFYNELRNSGGCCNQNNEGCIDVILKAHGGTATSSVVHEVLHAMAYYKSPSTGTFESGFNSSNEKTKNGFRKYQLFNEVANEYMTQSVMALFSEDELKQMGLPKQSNNIYQDMIPLVEDVLGEYEPEIATNVISQTPMDFARLIGKDNFNGLAIALDNVYGQANARLYDNSTTLEYLEKLLQKRNSPLLKDGEQITLSMIQKNVKTLKSMFANDNYITSMLNSITDLNETKDQIMQNAHSNEME